jgi:hypothetical protein
LCSGEQIGKGGPGDPQPLRGDDEPSGGFGTLTLSVPADKLDSALDQLTRIGTVLRRNTSSQDVTSQYVDTESRLKTMRASVARVRALMTQAKDIGQVVTLEGEVSRREADLESLASQLDALKTSVERSTLAVSLSTPWERDGCRQRLPRRPAFRLGRLHGLRPGALHYRRSRAAVRCVHRPGRCATLVVVAPSPGEPSRCDCASRARRAAGACQSRCSITAVMLTAVMLTAVMLSDVVGTQAQTFARAF